MRRAREILEKLVGPLTIGQVIRIHRQRNELSIEALAKKMKTTKGFISNVETGRKEISLEKCLEFALALNDSTYYFAVVWFEQQARKVGLDWKKIISNKAA